MGRTLLDKLWDAHVVADLGDGWSLLHIDRHLLHDLSGTAGLEALAARGLTVRNPDLAFATADHAVSSAPGRTGESYAPGAPLWSGLKARSAQAGLHYFELGEVGQGIVHVMGPELGITLPGVSLICGDSHTCTHGGLGALAFGVGSSELTHALATQTLRQQKPKRLRVRFEGTLSQGLAPKDLILHLIGRLGAAAGTGHAVEYAGSAIRSLGIEGRMTVCNLSIELGAKIGMVAPDDTTFAYVENRRFAPKGALFDRAVAEWRSLASDPDALFDREEVIDVAEVKPTVTWGTSPEHAIPIDAAIPDPRAAPDPERREAWRAALAYMGLEPGQPLAGTPVDWVFIGSCTNSRLSDLREAAALARGRHVAPGVTAWVVPGSERVKRDAEAEGLDQVFRDAGFAWREPGCSLCVAANGERVPPGARAVSTSNRNFVGRQGPGARTHLASPAMAVAAAVTGALTDVRRI
ncbi:3-isopropylmalate/(R)-2-methylmalate dehydratase large subunit [Methylobacterium sp. ap11]|uniref:3-isopropylmalate dehydratase large subunit n=1 Tax=Methylobacterium sp. ap11 TaxID=1761799 RepID=UPI0008B34998|nr:3-isopropylmalate dehydratase large subunit [Methylobacterium sp. ap11]SEP30350.1 3-isopropylmalate/(R)-2-methylmalate dehydratase large subunit [Methylobacterium sp. ap11]